MNTTSSRLAILGLVAPMMLGLAVAAHAESGRADAERACAHDAMSLCSQFIPDETTTGACLRSHLSALSAECQAVMAPAHKGHGHYRHRGHHRR